MIIFWFLKDKNRWTMLTEEELKFGFTGWIVDPADVVGKDAEGREVNHRHDGREGRGRVKLMGRGREGERGNGASRQRLSHSGLAHDIHT